MEQSRERGSAFPYTSVQLQLKREPSGCPRLQSPTLLIYIYIYIYIYVCVCVCVCVSVRVYVFCVCMCVCVCVCLYVCV